MYSLEVLDSQRGFIRSGTNINDIEKILVEYANPRSIFHSVLAFELCKRSEKTVSVIKTKVYEFENSAENRGSLEKFLLRMKEVNKDLKIIYQVCKN